MKTILVEQRQGHKYKLIAHWVYDGIPFFQGFSCRKDLDEYFAGWIGWKIKEI